MLEEAVESLRRQILAEMRRSYLNCELTRDVSKEISVEANRSEDKSYKHDIGSQS